MKYSEFIEKKQHGTPAFPVEYYYLDKSHPRYVMDLHWHKEYEIIKVRSGSLTVYLNSTKYILNSGDCLFIEGGCLKRGYPHNCVYECLVFDVSALNGRLGNSEEKFFLDLNGTDIMFKNFISNENTEILSTVNELFETTSSAGKYYEIKTVGLLYMLFYELYLSGYIFKSSGVSVDKSMQTVILLLKWIDEHYSERITLAEISEVVGLSEKYICRIFKEYTSKTIIDYVNERRIEKACVEITAKSITEIAFNCGFNDLSYFCKMFKKYKNTTPSQYKKDILKSKI